MLLLLQQRQYIFGHQIIPQVFLLGIDHEETSRWIRKERAIICLGFMIKSILNSIIINPNDYRPQPKPFPLQDEINR